MTALDRRDFLGSMAALAPVTMLRPTSLFEYDFQDEPPLANDVLQPLARAVLPGELTDDAVLRVAAAFQDWLAAYDPMAELNHGYGTAEIRYLPPDPAPTPTSNRT